MTSRVFPATLVLCLTSLVFGLAHQGHAWSGEDSKMRYKCNSVVIEQTTADGKRTVIRKQSCGPVHVVQSTGNNRAVVIQGKLPPGFEDDIKKIFEDEAGQDK